MDKNKILNISITGAAGQIAYSFLPMIASGQIFGNEYNLNLSLLDIPQCDEILRGVVMELEDGAYKNFSIKYYGSDANIAFKDADVAIFFGGLPRKEGMERKELLQKNANIFIEQGKILNEVGKETCKCLVVANPANTNCLILSNYATKIPKKNFTCLTRLDENRAKYQISKKTNSNISDIKNLIIWGNHSSTQFPDVYHGSINNRKIAELVNDEEWLKNEYIQTVQKRGQEIIKARKLSSAMSAAQASVDHLRDWFKGTKEGEYVSMGVITGHNNDYDIESNLCFSFPCVTKEFDYNIVTGLELNDFSKSKISATQKELLEERRDITFEI